MTTAVGKNPEPKITAFQDIHNEFMRYGWNLTCNESDALTYTKRDKNDEFTIKVNTNSIEVGVPLNNSPFQYKTSVTEGYQSVSNFIYMHLTTFEHYLSSEII